MQIVNETAFQAGWTTGFRPDGRELATVVVKATYRLRSASNEEPELYAAQDQLVESDEFGRDPARDAPLQENDFAPFKPACDVVVSAKAYPVRGRQATQVEVGFRLGACHKSFRVVGERHWYTVFGSTKVSDPKPFVAQAITYDDAYGGVDSDPDNPKRIATFASNPAGTGYCVYKQNLDGLRLPLTEEIDQPISDLVGKYRPMALGPLGRNWLPRSSFVGTYDEKWMAERLPFLPADFDYRYFQSSAHDQQIAYPRGGEMLQLTNLSPEGTLVSRLPQQGIVVCFVRKSGELTHVDAVLDTVRIDVEADKLSLTWRASSPMYRDAFELREMLVCSAAEYNRTQVKARVTGKAYYKNLAELAVARRSDKGQP